ncbi:MAG TPA: hypothetical protein DER23_07780 [Clostridiales bacterium]|jgi:predicted  nucleic acid-binding Zn-ribbon protein|nr:hypothetical protein [Clostridiales bacterium]HCG36226.1 hypothetical protein [Clostridiales bacterium]
MAKGILFDKEYGGFNKEQVNAFIIHLNEMFQDELEQQNEHILSLTASLQQTQAQLSCLQSDHETIESEYASLKEELETLRAHTDELAVSLRDTHDENLSLKQSLANELAKRMDENGAIPVTSPAPPPPVLIEEAARRLESVLLAKDTMIEKLDANKDKIMISKEEFIKLVDKLSADAAGFYSSLTDGDRL